MGGSRFPPETEELAPSVVAVALSASVWTFLHDHGLNNSYIPTFLSG